jgi:hypothetical protein
LPGCSRPHLPDAPSASCALHAACHPARVLAAHRLIILSLPPPLHAACHSPKCSPRRFPIIRSLCAALHAACRPVSLSRPPILQSHSCAAVFLKRYP